MARYQIAVAWRVLVEALLNLAGLLNVRAAFALSQRRPRIVFQAYAEHLAMCFAPIIDRLRTQAPDVEIHFIVLPHPQFTFRSLFELRAFVRDSLAVPTANIRFFWQALWHRYDLLICADVYAKFPLRHTRTVLLKHGAGVASRILRRHWLRKTIVDFDLVLVNGEEDRDLLRRYGEQPFATDRVVAAGLPYLDRLQTCAESREAYLGRMGIGLDQRVALVGPSWRGLQMIHSREPRYFDDLIAVLQALDSEVVIKMHACSFNKAMVDGHDWTERMSRYQHPNIHIDNDVDDVPAFLYADILITDISSRAFDFMLLDKPVIAVFPSDLFTDALDVERIRLLRQGAQLIESSGELETALARAFNECDRVRSERRQVARRVFANPGCATEVVVDHLLRQLNTENPTCAV